MTDDDLFAPSERDRNGDLVSPSDLGVWGDESTLDPAWEAMEQAETAEAFYRAAAVLVFHARHMHPTLHARLARQLMRPFKRARGRPEDYERTEYIAQAIGDAGPLRFHEWQGLTRSEMIPKIQEHFRIPDERTAGAAFDKAKRHCRQWYPDRAAEHDELERRAKAARLNARHTRAKKT